MKPQTCGHPTSTRTSQASQIMYLECTYPSDQNGVVEWYQPSRVLLREQRGLEDRDWLILLVRGDFPKVTWLVSGKTKAHFYLCYSPSPLIICKTEGLGGISSTFLVERISHTSLLPFPHSFSEGSNGELRGSCQEVLEGKILKKKINLSSLRLLVFPSIPLRYE